MQRSSHMADTKLFFEEQVMLAIVSILLLEVQLLGFQHPFVRL